ncbi:MAG: hypothetical protein EXX96DRAFT_551941 [Benjaminiella poitrasii]|nr:MAG: hypothetical protein EXX96DRAFT_551941 [Benjaminiella poitrasii]
MLSKLSCISVQLLEPTLYVDPNSDMSNVIRGSININLLKTTAIKSLSVRFDGKMETKSYSFDVIENMGGFAQKKPLARQRLVLYPTLEQDDASRPLVMNAGLTQFGFEMQVPSRLPETIECSDINVHYYVTAVIEYYNDRSFFARAYRRNLVKEFAKQDVRVARLPYENIFLGDAMSNPIDSRTHKCGWLNYQILVDKKAVALGSELPITFRMAPTFDDGVTVDRVNIQMLERRDLHRDSTYTTHSVHTIQPSQYNTTSFPTEPLKNDPWEGTMVYKIPDNKELVHSTQEYSDFSVSHTLLITIALSIPGTSSGRYTSSRRTQKIVTFQAHIDILDEAIGRLDTLKLPTYDAPPPFEETNEDSEPVYIDYDRKYPDPPAYDEIFAQQH